MERPLDLNERHFVNEVIVGSEIQVFNQRFDQKLITGYDVVIKFKEVKSSLSWQFREYE
jgi:hypothetical protein